MNVDNKMKNKRRRTFINLFTKWHYFINNIIVLCQILNKKKTVVLNLNNSFPGWILKKMNKGVINLNSNIS